MTEILTCPNCKTVPELQESSTFGMSGAGRSKICLIECCGVRTPLFNDPQHAINNWNEKVDTLDINNVNPVIDVEPITEPKADEEIELDADQEKAVEAAVNSRFAIINGGAGTGKTTIIKNIAARIGSCKLCAFVGKAAARLKEATGMPASTIHRLLMFSGSRFMLPDLMGQTVIIDEASMIASDLMAEIIRREPKRLILVGDESQLSPVGKGQPFHDMIKFMPDKVCTLKNCYRNTEAVFKAATMIREGRLPAAEDQSENEKWTILKSGVAFNTHKAILGMVADGEIDFNTDIILCPTNGTDDQPCTVKGLNKSIVDVVNPRDGDEKFLVGDRVINTKNYAEHDVWNGTAGTIHSIDYSGGIWIKLDIPITDWEATVDPKDPIYKYEILFNKTMVKSLQLAYALTVHKSQGSQYRKVVVVVLERDSHMILTRPLVYTAVTRAQKECIVAGQVQALWKAIERGTYKRTIIREMAQTAKRLP